MNDLELRIKAMLEKRGYEVLRNGWPDFLCVGTSPYGNRPTLMGVEVKSPNDDLSPDQIRMHQVLGAARIPIFVVKGGAGVGPAELPALRHTYLLTRTEINQLRQQYDGVVAQAEQLRGLLQDLGETLEACDPLLEPSRAQAALEVRP
jgi:VRR-NUC domain